ncbi:MAG: hypothetical protein KDK12_18290 [Rhodobacteraceae bacterium]|nr:hypothetical protein [Paracoccaceae bacterium]
MKAIRIAATVALVLGTASAAAATSVTVHDLGNGNINCVTAGGNVYISARMRGNYNQQCIMALRAAGVLSDFEGSFSNIDLLATDGAATVLRGRGDFVSVDSTTMGAGSTTVVEVHQPGARVNTSLIGRNGHMQVTILP